MVGAKDGLWKYPCLSGKGIGALPVAGGSVCVFLYRLFPKLLS